MLTSACEATFSSPVRCMRSHQDELSASSTVPEMEAPGPDAGWGFLFWPPQLAASALNHAA
jgi:hypothetical protein